MQNPVRIQSNTSRDFSWSFIKLIEGLENQDHAPWPSFDVSPFGSFMTVIETNMESAMSNYLHFWVEQNNKRRRK